MKMKEFTFMPFIVKVSILSTLTQSILAVLNKNILETKYIEDLCSSEKVQELNVSMSGTAPALKIKSKNENLTADHCSCSVVIKSSDGIILNFVSSTGVQFEKHSDSIQILADYKNSTKVNHHESSHVFKRAVRLTFSTKCCLPEEKFSITGTAYRQGEVCIDEEFKCDTGECLRKTYFCDGLKNCPDGSDELFSKNCIPQPNIHELTRRRPRIDWNMVFPTSKSIVEYRKSFNYTVTSAVACAFVIFVFGILRLACHYHCAERETQRQPPPPQRPFATFSTFSIIRQRPDFQPQHQCPPPPSYVSLISDRSNNTSNGNPPAYSSVMLAEENCQTEENKENAKNSGRCEPPPPYEP